MATERALETRGGADAGHGGPRGAETARRGIRPVGPTIGRRFALGVVGMLACGAILGCGPGEARAPNPTRPLDERRAIEVIRRAMKSEGVEPSVGRDERVAGSSKTIHLDVGVQGKRYGVSFVTTEDAQALADSIPAPNQKDERLKLVPAGDDGRIHVLLLFQQNYRYDDLAGDAHEQTTISAEAALARDVRDFVTYARSKSFE